MEAVLVAQVPYRLQPDWRQKQWLLVTVAAVAVYLALPAKLTGCERFRHCDRLEQELLLVAVVLVAVVVAAVYLALPAKLTGCERFRHCDQLAQELLLVMLHLSGCQQARCLR